MLEHEKMMRDLERILATQNFDNKEELQSFIEKLSQNPIPELPAESLTKTQKAQDIVYNAYKLPPDKAAVQIKKALKLDPDCIDAYVFIAESERDPIKAAINYEIGIKIGRKLFGGDFLKHNIGHFWLIHETRPYMRALHGYAMCWYTLGDIVKSVQVLEEIILLNPNDNQGVRFQLLILLIGLGEDKKFKSYAAMFKGEQTAFMLYNLALFAFKTEGDTVKSVKKLKDALKNNKFVPKHLLSKNNIFDLPAFYGRGDDNEAIFYTYYSRPVWKIIDGALPWLKKHVDEIREAKKIRRGLNSGSKKNL